jgi:hypothetical protein
LWHFCLDIAQIWYVGAMVWMPLPTHGEI